MGADTRRHRKVKKGKNYDDNSNDSCCSSSYDC